MAISKVRIRWGWLGLVTVCWLSCGVDPKARLRSEVEAMVAEANEGQHGQLEKGMSVALRARIQAEGWEPAKVLQGVAKMDREDGAKYRMTDLPKFEGGDYAEVEIARKKGEEERRWVMPFVREEGKWRAGATFRDGRAWEAENF